MPNQENSTQDRELRLLRTLRAPVRLVWEVWTDPAHLARWWGPHGFTNTITKMDMRPGGAFDLVMHGPDGTDYKNRSVFREVIPFKKIVYEHLSGPKFIATIEFTDKGEQTELSWHMLFDTAEEFTRTVKTFGADKGQKENVEKLSDYLSRLRD